MKQKLFSIFFALAMLLPISVVANVNVNIVVNGSAGGTVSYSYNSAKSSTSNGSTTSSATISSYTGKQSTYYVNLTATPATGYEFTSWSVNNSGTLSSTTSTTTKLTIPKNCSTVYTVTAYFTATATYDISTAVTPAGYGTVSSSPSSLSGLASGTSVTLTANPTSSAYYLDYWTNSAGTTVSTDNPYTFSATADDTYTAHFAVCADGTTTGTASPAEGGTVTVSPSGSQTGGTTVTLTATSADGYAFSQWNDGNTDNPRTVYTNGDVTYTATFVNGYTDAFYYSDVKTNIGTISMSAGTGWRVHVGRVSDDFYKESIHIDFLLKNSLNTATGYYVYGSNNAPYPGVYTSGTNTISSSNYGKWCINTTSGDYSRWAAYYTEDGTCLYIESGTIIVSVGSDLDYPYIQIIDAVLSNGATLNCTIGTPGIPDDADHFTWDMIYGISNIGSNGNYWLNSYTWWDNNTTYLRLYFYYDNVTSPIRYTCTTTSDNISGAYYMPAKGVYTIGTSLSDMTVTGNGTSVSSTDRSSFVTYDGLSTAYRLTTATNYSTVIVSEGEDGPFIQIPAGTSWYLNGYTYDNDGVYVGNPPTYYTPTFKANDSRMGSVEVTYVSGYVYEREIEYKKNSIYSVSATPNTGYHYVSWSDGLSQTHNITITSSSTYTANFAANTYTVVFNANDGSGTMSNQAFTYGTAQTLTANAFTRSGYTFAGWATSSDATTATYTDGESVSNLTTTDGGTVTLYAVWESSVVTYTVTYNASTYGTGDAIADDTKTAGEDLTLSSSTFTRTGYTQTGWSTTDGGDKAYDLGGTYSTDDDLDLYPYWEINKYTVTVAKNNNDYGTLTNESENVRVINNVPYGSTFTVDGSTITINGTTVTATPAAATAQYTYAFSNWTNGAATVTDAMTITANFTRTVNTYDITWKSEDGTSTLETDEAQAYGTATAYNEAIPTKTVTGYTYTFDGWATSANGEKAYNNGETPTVSGAATYYAHFTGGANTYTVTFAANGGSGTMADQAFTYGTAQNLRANTFTGPAATVTYDYNGATGGNSKASETVYATFSGWLGSNSNTYTDEQEVNNLTTTNGATVTMAAQWEMFAEVTLPQPTKTGYTLYAWEGEVDGMPLSIDETDDWSFLVTAIEPVTMTAQWNIVPYTITYEGLEGATNSNPTSYNVETATIVLADPGTRDGYIFAGWKDESDNTITQIAKGSTGNRTLTATWNVKSSDITLCENCNDAHYNTFKANYNNKTVNVTYPRQFAEGRWSTMCLPFNLDLATMITNKMYGCVYEFKYATGNANVGSGVNLYFSNAKSIEAGKCYIVNANSALAEKTSFVFSGVTIDLSKDNGAALDSEDAYDDLPGYKSQGTIELVGTLRNGTLKGTESGNTYMGLKSNKIYYPNISQGSTIWAYRGIFRSSEILDKESMQKMRIIVDGEDRGELIIDADGDILAPSDAASRKFIRDGVLYIEREGVIYDAQGKRIK